MKVSTTIFSCNEVTEHYWDVVIDGVPVKISDKYMGEMVQRYLDKKKLKAVDADGKTVRTGWLTK